MKSDIPVVTNVYKNKNHAHFLFHTFKWCQLKFLYYFRSVSFLSDGLLSAILNILF